MKRLIFLAALLAPACGGGSGSGGGTTTNPPANPRILLFVAADQVWWAEYKVLYEAFRAAGYHVDVRSSASGTASSYQSDGDVETSADSLAGSSYSAFTSAYAAHFGAGWDATWNAAADIPLDGRLQDVTSIAGYDALAIAGGIGAVEYRLDGAYASAEIQAASEKLASLVVEARAADKPVLAECHGATLPAFAVAVGSATGFPGGDTAAVYTNLGVAYLANRPVVVDGSVVTSRDWYPQTIAHAAKTVTNMLATTPANLGAPASVLVVHGGAADVPQLYPTPPVTGADLVSLLAADSPADPFSFVVSELNLLGGALPFNLSDAASVLAYLSTFDVVVIFKHWNSSFTTALQTALHDYADAGGGLVALHHALYNHSDASGNKNVFCQEVFGAESASANWSARPPSAGAYAYLSTNTGHFVSTYSVAYASAPVVPPAGFPASPEIPNRSGGGYPALWLTDEIYQNLVFTGAPVFGDGVGEVNLLFANDHVTFPAQVHTAGFTKLFDPSGDGSIGRLVFLQPGERVENVQVGAAYAQVVRNAVVWASR